MKKILYLGSCCVCAALLLTSCFSSTVCVGDMKPSDPCYKVDTKKNHHFLYGLIGRPEIKGKNYVDGAKSYKVKRSQTFVDGLLQSVTFGIYTPTTTTFYVPRNAKKSKARRSHDDDDD